MTFWQKIFRNPAPSADRRYYQLVTVLLHHQRLMGEIILQLPHRFDRQLQATMGLAWVGNQLVISVNPDRLLALRQDDAVLLLAHLSRLHTPIISQLRSLFGNCSSVVSWAKLPRVISPGRTALTVVSRYAWIFQDKSAV